MLGKVGEVQSPHLVLPLTVESTKPRLSHDACFWTFGCKTSRSSWIMLVTCHVMFHGTHIRVFLMTSLDTIIFFWRMTVEHFSAFNTLPFGWKISPYVYHNTGLVATNFFDLWMSLVVCILMIATTDNYKFPLIRGYTLIFRPLMSVDLQLQNQPFFLWLIFWFNLGIF